ncbi:MAG: hypothetical protein IEMM0008_1686 [bacterium]|nr:MAG: hypothetical protein IEMM0008_1686 [bacterium]
MLKHYSEKGSGIFFTDPRIDVYPSLGAGLKPNPKEGSVHILPLTFLLVSYHAVYRPIVLPIIDFPEEYRYFFIEDTIQIIYGHSVGIILLAKINDAQIKELITKYQQNKDFLEEIIAVLSEYIYNYPKIIHQQREDVCGDFYLYFFEKLPQTLLKYNVEDCNFTTWLSVVLLRQYLNWVKKNERKSVKSILYLEDFVSRGENQLSQEFKSSLDQEVRDREILDVLNSLPKKVGVVMKLHYFDFFEGKDLKDISEIFDKSLSDLIEGYDKILIHVFEQHEKENELMDKLNSVYSQVIYYKEKLKHLGNENKEKREEYLKKIQLYEGRQEKHILSIRRFYVSVKNPVISDFLGIAVNAVHNLVHRGKILLEQKLKGKYSEKKR